MQNKVSVIIPIYKVENFLNKCVESVVRQTYKNLEIILVDDGSTDNCPKMCDDWAKKDKRIKVIHKKNGGLSDARNKGLDVATGSYITFVDSDDYLDEYFVEKTLKCAKENNADVVCTKFLKFYEDKAVNQEKFSSKTSVFKAKNEIMSLMYSNEKFNVTAWAKLYKAQIFNNLRFKKGKINEDVFICHHVLDRTQIYVYIDCPLYFYLQRENSIMSVRFTKKRLDGFEAIQERHEFIKEKYPLLINEENKSFMCSARYFYFLSNKNKLGKNELKNIREKFKQVYKQSKKKGFANILFYLFPKIYCFVYSFKRVV